jgi:hypothetical protein
VSRSAPRSAGGRGTRSGHAADIVAHQLLFVISQNSQKVSYMAGQFCSSGQVIFVAHWQFCVRYVMGQIGRHSPAYSTGSCPPGRPCKHLLYQYCFPNSIKPCCIRLSNLSILCNGQLYIYCHFCHHCLLLSSNIFPVPENSQKQDSFVVKLD